MSLHLSIITKWFLLFFQSACFVTLQLLHDGNISAYDYSNCSHGCFPFWWLICMICLILKLITFCFTWPLHLGNFCVNRSTIGIYVEVVTLNLPAIPNNSYFKPYASPFYMKFSGFITLHCPPMNITYTDYCMNIITFLKVDLPSVVCTTIFFDI